MQYKNLTIIKSCSKISIYAFLMASFKGDMRYLIKGFDDEDEGSYKEHEDSSELQLVYKELHKEYKTLVADKKVLRREREFISILELNTRYSLVTHVLTMYNENPFIEILDVLNSIEGMSFDPNKDISKQIELTTKKAYGWKNKLKIMEVNFRKKYKIKDEEDENEDEDYANLLSNLDKKALFHELNLETGYRIDPKNTDVIRWVNLEERSNAKLERNG